MKREIRIAKEGVEMVVTKNLKQDTKSCYRLICLKCKFRDKIGPLVDVTGQLEWQDREMAHMFNACHPLRTIRKRFAGGAT